MTDKDKTEKMAQENLTILLEEFTKEQQANNQLLLKLKQSVDNLTKKIGTQLHRSPEEILREKFENTKKIQEVVRSSAVHFQLAAAKMRPVVRKFVIQLFPEKMQWCSIKLSLEDGF